MTNLRLPYCSVQIIINGGKQKEMPVYQQVDDADKCKALDASMWRGNNTLLVHEVVQKVTHCLCSHFPNNVLEKYKI